MNFVYFLGVVCCGSESLIENIVKGVLVKLGCEDEEAGLVAVEYLKGFQDLRWDKFVEEASLSEISSFWKEWRINMWEEIAGIRLEADSELLAEMDYGVMKMMKSNFDDLEIGVAREKKVLSRDMKESVCGVEENNSFYI